MKATKYVARKPDENGFIEYSREEHETWRILYQRQIKLVEKRACSEFLNGLDKFDFADGIPQLDDVDRVLNKTTGWSVSRVPALISFDRFFALLANKQFPVATFIRSREELDYLQEPDVFHEIFGHCPLLTDPDFAAFTEAYGELGLSASKEERVYLARLYWMTVEFGLLQSEQGQKIYGGGILSSYGETLYCLDSTVPEKLSLDPMIALRTPYRIDILQPVYFVIENMGQLQKLSEMDIMAMVHKAMKMELLPARFSPKKAS